MTIVIHVVFQGLDHSIEDEMDATCYRVASRVVSSSRLSEGSGFPVRRPFGEGETVPHLGGVFLMLDHMGPVATMVGAPTHPHRGFETLSYVLSGSVQHRDSTGKSGVLLPGGAQWMTAGRGVVHSEMPVPGQGKGTVFEGFQLWINLPAGLKMCPPRYQDLKPEQIPVIPLSPPLKDTQGTDTELPAITDAMSGIAVSSESMSIRSKGSSSASGQARVQVIAGSYGGVLSPVSTHTPVTVLDVTLTAQHNVLTLPVPDGHVCAVYVYRGAVLVGPERLVEGGKGAGAGRGAGGKPVLVEESQCAIMADVATVAPACDTDRTANESVLRLEATSTGSDPPRPGTASLLILHAAPLTDPVVRRGPFVLCTEKALKQAELDFAAGKLVPNQAAAVAHSLGQEAAGKEREREKHRKGRGGSRRGEEDEGEDIDRPAKASEEEDSNNGIRKSGGRGKR